MVVDFYDAKLQSLNTLCRQYLCLENEATGRPAPEPRFHVESCILLIISFSANRRSHPLIRREAICPLEAFNKVESTISHPNIAMWSRLLIEIEERHCIYPLRSSRDIARLHRVRSIDTSYHFSGHAPHLDLADLRVKQRTPKVNKAVSDHRTGVLKKDLTRVRNRVKKNDVAWTNYYGRVAFRAERHSHGGCPPKRQAEM